MPHPVVYPGSMDALVKEWEEKVKKAWGERREAGLATLKIADGECARLPQVLAKIGHTSLWQRGERVIDVAKTLRSGTVIANFVFEDGRWKYPNRHGWHAALFMSADGYSMTTGKPSRIWMFDQWKGKWPSPRGVQVAPASSTKKPSDRAEEFYVVLVK